MRHHAGLLGLTLAGIFMMGCVSPSGRPDYTASGALFGSAIGGLGSDSGKGAVVGALIGGLIGHGLDQAQEIQLKNQAPQTMQRVEQGLPLSVQDIKALAMAGISDDLIISQIRNSRTIYHLATADIIDLKNSGVSERVIDFMINTPNQVRSSEVSGVSGNTSPAPLVEPVLVSPGPEFIWVVGTWAWLGDRWLWRPGYWHRPVRPYPYPPHSGPPGFHH